MNKQLEEKLRKDGYTYWEVAEKDIKRIYINNSLKFLNIDGKDAYTKPLIINNIDFSEYCLNVRKTLFKQFDFSSKVKIFYDCINEEFAYSTRDSLYNELAQTIVDKLNEEYYTEKNEDNDEEATIENQEIKTMYTDIIEEYGENDILNYNGQKIRIIKRDLLSNLTDSDIEVIFGGCFVDNNDFTKRQAYKYQYVEL